MAKHFQHLDIGLIPNLRQIQLDSFSYFLLYLLPLELEKLSYYQIKTDKFGLQFYSTYYKLKKPRYSSEEAMSLGLSYLSELYFPVYLCDFDYPISEFQTVCLGSIPLMTLNATFIINGISRSIVSQLVRSPGIYYTLNVENYYIATIISNSGKRLKLKLIDDEIWLILQNNATLPLFVLLIASGLSNDSIPTQLYSSFSFDLKKTDFFSYSVEGANLYIGTIIKSNFNKPNIVPNYSDQILQEYNLGSIGRFNFNRRLNLSDFDTDPNLRMEDLISAALYLHKFKDSTESLDDIDDLKHKRIKCVGDVIHEYLHTNLTLLKRKIQNTLTKRTITRRTVSPDYFFVLSIFNFERFLGSYELSQFIDQTNPLSDLVHKRKISALGPGGLTPRTARFRVRDIHPSQYGRICPIETAEGERAGIVTALTTSAGIDKHGRIANLLFCIKSTTLKGHPIYTIAHNDENARLATGRVLEPFFTPVQHRREFSTMFWEEATFRSLFPLHFFSIGVSLIPFLEHDDSTRALMGSNMQRQALILLNPERPIVGTGLEGQIGLDSGNTYIAETASQISYVDRQTIVRHSIENKTLSQKDLLKYIFLNNNSLIIQKPLASLKKYISKGQLLAESNATVGGELALGQNVLVAYMPWEGYNFEDAILINERLVQENIYTSIHIERYDIEIRQNIEVREYLTSKVPHLPSTVLRHLNDQGIVKIGRWVEPGDVLVGKLITNDSLLPAYGPEGLLLQDIFGIEVMTTEESCLKVPLRGSGRVLDVRSIHSESLIGGTIHTIHVYILQKRPIQVGDKLAGRHGNKGVVSKILPREDMPYLADGTSIDMVLSPLGVPSRMNVGQIFEALLGFTGEILAKHYRILPFDERYENQASRKLVLSELYQSSQNPRFPCLFDINTPGKIRLFDGRTGNPFEQTVTVGKAYMFKLIHQVNDKIHARSTGPYAIVTQQPLRGKSRHGGQRVGEMEVWAFQGFGAAYSLHELLTLKSDHLKGRSSAIKSIVKSYPVRFFSTASDCLRTFIRELWCLGLEINETILGEDTGLLSSKDL
jgi:DNA-directed RNA polymerase subunit beta